MWWSITFAIILIFQLFFFSFIFYKWFQFYWIWLDNQRIQTELAKAYMLLSNNFNKKNVIKNYFTWSSNLNVAYYQIWNEKDLNKFVSRKFCIWKIYILYIPWESFQKLNFTNFINSFNDNYYFKIKHMRSFSCYSRYHVFDFAWFKYF